MKIGDKVLFAQGNVNELKDALGIIISIRDNDYAIIECSSCGYYLKYKTPYQIDSVINVAKVRQDIIDYYTPLINEHKNKLKRVTTEEKMQERVKKYNDIKYRIIKNCERVAICEDDDEFENRLKEINKLKKEIHAINLDSGDIIRKENAKIKYDMRQVEQRMNSSLYKISDEEIEKTFSKI